MHSKQEELHFLLLFLVSFFTASTVPSISRPDFFSDFTIVIISFMSSFEKNKVNHFLTRMAPRPLIFLSSLSNIDKVHLFANFVKVSLAKVTGRFVSASLPNLPIVLLRYLSYGIILVNLA